MNYSSFNSRKKRFCIADDVHCFVFLIPSVVHATDPTRMELVIPGEQYFYLKAGGAAERQKWLVALGSSKACLGDSRSQKERGWFSVNRFALRRLQFKIAWIVR